LVAQTRSTRGPLLIAIANVEAIACCADQINERAIAALGGEEEEPDIITPLGGRKSSSESYLAMPVRCDTANSLVSAG